MTEEITRLITEITRSSSISGAASDGRVHRQSAIAGVGLVGRRLVWALALGISALAIGASLMLAKTDMTRPHRQVMVRQPILPRVSVPPVSRNEVASATHDGTTHQLSLEPIVGHLLRRTVLHPARQVRSARTSPAHRSMIAVSRPRSEPVPSRPAKTSLLDRPSPHLKGLALERALAEDAAITRRLNLDQLKRSLKPGTASAVRP